MSQPAEPAPACGPGAGGRTRASPLLSSEAFSARERQLKEAKKRLLGANTAAAGLAPGTPLPEPGKASEGADRVLSSASSDRSDAGLGLGAGKAIDSDGGDDDGLAQTTMRLLITSAPRERGSAEPPPRPTVVRLPSSPASDASDPGVSTEAAGLAGAPWPEKRVRTKSRTIQVKVVNHTRSESGSTPLTAGPAAPADSGWLPAPGEAPELELDARYRVFRELGSGAFATVRYGVDQRTSAPVAVKMIDKAVLKSSESLRLTIGREVEVLKTLAHCSGIVRLLDVVDVPTHLCLVLEYVAGGELFDLIADYRAYLTEAEARRLFRELATTVQEMHLASVCHRDIKVENVLLTCRPHERFRRGSLLSTDVPADGAEAVPHVRLVDFGLARHFAAGELMTTRCGSEEYAAPEIVLGQQYDGVRTDVWALGCVLYAMLVGRLPFEADPRRGGRRAMLWRVIRQEVTWPDGCGVSDGARALVAGILTRADRRLLTQGILDDPWLCGGSGR